MKIPSRSIFQSQRRVVSSSFSPKKATETLYSERRSKRYVEGGHLDNKYFTPRQEDK